MLSKTKLAVSVAIVLSNAFSASGATKHHRVTHVYPAIYNRVIPAAAGGDGRAFRIERPQSGIVTGRALGLLFEADRFLHFVF